MVFIFHEGIRMEELSGLEQGIYRLALALPGLLMAIVVHEVAHGVVALKFGDPTAKNEGRITLNPISHLDLMGSIVFPLIMVVFNMGIYGWAKPVPINARNFKNPNKGVFWVSFAGPLSNFILMIISAFLFALLQTESLKMFSLAKPFSDMLIESLKINVVICVFNLLPFPPLDGSKMLETFLSYNAQKKYEYLSQFSFPFFLLLIFTGALNYVFYPMFAFADFVVKFFLRIL
jgi:Zn-dependent protease